MIDDLEEVEPDRGLGIRDVKLLLEKVFQGCKVRTPNSMGGSFHAELTFFEYEIRVILSGKRAVDRKIHYRFMQRVEHSDGKRSVKRMIQDVEMNSEADLLEAIEATKAYLMGIVFAISKAMKPPHVPRTDNIEDLFRDIT